MAVLIQDKQVNTISTGSFNELSASVFGSFRTFDTFELMISESASRITNNQLAWCQETQTIHQATKIFAELEDIFEDSIQWNEFNGFTNQSGDINSVTAGSGLLGGGLAGDLIITLDTGSAHFEDGVEKVVIVTTLDGGDI